MDWSVGLMSLRSMQRIPQNKVEFALGLLFRLSISLPFAVLGWLLLDDPFFALFVAAIGLGSASGYAFVHGQTTFRDKLSLIGSWAFGIGILMFICAFALRLVFAEQSLAETVGGSLVVAVAVSVAFFGMALWGEAKKHREESW